MNTVDAALRYALQGWPVLPLIGKKPMLEHGVYSTSTDPQQLRRWFANPRLNIGVALPEILVVDIDSKNDGPAWFATHRRQLHAVTLTCRTGSSWWHFYFQRPQGVELRGIIVKGVDLRRGAGHYVVAPPSIHPVTGRRYEWILSWPQSPQPLPAWLLETCRRPVLQTSPRQVPRDRDHATALTRARKYVEKVEPAISGSNGRCHTFVLCLKLASAFPELNLDDLLDVLSDWNLACVPPWRERELRQKLGDAVRSARGGVAA